jgi:hypothetical protein
LLKHARTATRLQTETEGIKSPDEDGSDADTGEEQPKYEWTPEEEADFAKQLQAAMEADAESNNDATKTSAPDQALYPATLLHTQSVPLQDLVDELVALLPMSLKQLNISDEFNAAINMLDKLDLQDKVDVLRKKADGVAKGLA